MRLLQFDFFNKIKEYNSLILLDPRFREDDEWCEDDKLCKDDELSENNEFREDDKNIGLQQSHNLVMLDATVKPLSFY